MYIRSRLKSSHPKRREDFSRCHRWWSKRRSLTLTSPHIGKTSLHASHIIPKDSRHCKFTMFSRRLRYIFKWLFFQSHVFFFRRCNLQFFVNDSCTETWSQKPGRTAVFRGSRFLETRRVPALVRLLPPPEQRPDANDAFHLSLRFS